MYAAQGAPRGRGVATRGCDEPQFGIEAVEADVELHAPAACQVGSDGVFLAEIGAQPGKLTGAGEPHYQLTEPLADATPAIAMRHMGRHHALTIEYRAMRHTDDDRGRTEGREMAVIDEVEALDVGRQLFVR